MASEDSGAQPTVAIAAQAAEPVKAAAAEPAACNARSWPYVSSDCREEQAPARQVRVISTDRDAPRLVPLPATVQASLAATQATAAPVRTANLTEAGEDLAATLLPPARPAGLGTDEPAKADPGVTAQADVDTTGSVAPAPERASLRSTREKSARKAEYRSRVARARDRARMDGRYASAEVDSPAQATVYRYPDGREVIVRTEPREMPRRRYADQGGGYADQAYGRSYEAPRYYPQRERSGGLLGMLFGD